MSAEQPEITLTEVSAFKARLVSNGVAVNTVKAYISDLDLFLAWAEREYNSHRADLVPVWLNEHRATWSPATTKRRVACMRAFGRFQGWIGFLEEYKVPKVASGVAHPLPGGVDDILQMYGWARPPHHKALVVLIGLLGCRVSEARSVRVQDFDDSTGDIILKVRGKGDKTRLIPVDEKVMALLDEPFRVAAERPDGLLVPINDRSARRAWTRIGRRARLARSTATHDGRMTAGTAFYDKNKDIRAVQDLLGHSSVATTEGYTGVTMAKKKSSAAIL